MSLSVKKILLISLSNLGDIILTTPVLTSLHKAYPEAVIDVITGLPGVDLFSAHPAVGSVEVHRKGSLLARCRSLLDIRQKKYDMVVDLKRSLVPYFSGAKYVSAGLLEGFPSKNDGSLSCCHKKDEHLRAIEDLLPEGYNNGGEFYIPVTDEEEESILSVLKGNEKPLAVLNAGAKSHLKRWDSTRFAHLAYRLSEEKSMRVALTGSDEDIDTVTFIMVRTEHKHLDLCGKTTIGELYALMRRAALVVTNDSAPLHVASAAGTPTVAIFGPTDENKYGPLSPGSRVVTPGRTCRPCEKALCYKDSDEGCINDITVDDVFSAAVEVIERSSG